MGKPYVPFCEGISKVTLRRLYEFYSTNMFLVSQEIPFPGKLHLKGKIADSRSKVIEQELNAKIRDVIAEVKKSYRMYWLAGKKNEIYRENIELMKRFYKISKSLYEVGKVTMSDVLKANVEIGKMESMLVMASQEELATQASLNALLNRNNDVPLGTPQQPEKSGLNYDLKNLKELASKNAPDIKSKELSYQSSKDAVTLSKLEWLPDFMVGAKLGQMDSTYMLQMALPLYFWKQTANVNKMKYEKMMNELESHTQNLKIQRDLIDLWSQYQAHEKFLSIYETNIIPLTKQTLTLDEEGYRTGRNNILDLFDSQKRYLDYSIEYNEHIADRENVLAELERLTGTDLEEK